MCLFVFYVLPHRTTILPPVDELDDMLTKFEDFHVITSFICCDNRLKCLREKKKL